MTLQSLLTAVLLPASPLAGAAPVTVDGSTITGVSAREHHLGLGATTSWNERPAG